MAEKEAKESKKDIKTIVEKAKEQLVGLTGFSSPSGIGIKKKNGGWTITIELVQKQSIPEGMDVLGIYEVETDQAGNISGYERKKIKRRQDATEEGE